MNYMFDILGYGMRMHHLNMDTHMPQNWRSPVHKPRHEVADIRRTFKHMVEVLKIVRRVNFVRYAVELVSAGDVRSVRPGLGLAPKWLPKLLGQCLKQDAQLHEPVGLQHFHTADLNPPGDRHAP